MTEGVKSVLGIEVGAGIDCQSWASRAARRVLAEPVEKRPEEEEDEWAGSACEVALSWP